MMLIEFAYLKSDTEVSSTSLPMHEQFLHLVAKKQHTMELLRRIALISLILHQVINGRSLQFELLKRPTDDNLYELQKLFAEILNSVPLKKCSVIITDAVHHRMYEASFFQRLKQLSPQFYIRVDNTEDLLAPNYQTVRMLKVVRTFKCDIHLVTLLNGIQIERFLRFVHRHRILNASQKFVFLHETRLLDREMLHVWSSFVSSVFVKPLAEKGIFSISTVPYPNILNGIVVTQHLVDWKRGKRLKGGQLFPDKSSNLKGVVIPVTVVQHMPMVFDDKKHNTFKGLEVEIVRALGESLNFKPKFYSSNDSETERWGRELPNGSYTGLIGQMMNQTARIAIGDLHFNKLYSSVMDLSTPHSVECLTFLTPESAQDNSWKTLIQPFSGSMWVGVLLSLFMVGTLFYIMSWVHAVALRRHSNASWQFFSLFRRKAFRSLFHHSLFPRCDFRDVKFRTSLNRTLVQSRREDIFDSFSNCILLTYSMLMYVALPRMPRNWPLRWLTGWYWMYCILLTATYRASFTALLANPAARITIDTLEELVDSRITTSVWGEENKKFFAEASDEVAQEIGLQLESIEDIHGVTDFIAKGTHAYYDNEFYLRHLRLLGSKRREDEKVLHVMRECVVRMPIVLGLEKNSPLKLHIDSNLQRLREGGKVLLNLVLGFLTKWLSDVTRDLPAEEQELPEALMDLRKFWSSFVALIIGYFIGLCAVLGEHLHFNIIVKKHPLYDKYNTRLYYNFKRRLAKQ